MKKFLIVLFIFIIHSQASVATDWRTQKGEIINGEFKVKKNMVLPLDPGEWLAIDRYTDMITHGIAVEGITFVQLKDNVPVKIFEIARATGLSKWQAYLTAIIEGAVFNSKEDGCRERQHYNYLNFYKKGNAHNCMMVTMLDVQRALNPSDYDPDKIFTLGIRNWVKKNNIKLPKMYLRYYTSFVSMMIRDEWYVALYAVTPEEFANYKPKFTSRDTTEFHPSLIDNYPEAKKTMQNWIKRSAEFQYNWEIFLKAKKSQKLDLSNYIEGTKKINNTNLKATNSIADQLKTLHDLYKSGALSGYEYEQAKKKILNK